MKPGDPCRVDATFLRDYEGRDGARIAVVRFDALPNDLPYTPAREYGVARSAVHEQPAPASADEEGGAIHGAHFGTPTRPTASCEFCENPHLHPPHGASDPFHGARRNGYCDQCREPYSRVAAEGCGYATPEAEDGSGAETVDAATALVAEAYRRYGRLRETTSHATAAKAFAIRLADALERTAGALADAQRRLGAVEEQLAAVDAIMAENAAKWAKGCTHCEAPQQCIDCGLIIESDTVDALVEARHAAVRKALEV